MKIITELCQNHNGDINIVKDMVEQSKLGGADICKIQSIKADSLTNRSEYETFRTTLFPYTTLFRLGRASCRERV